MRYRIIIPGICSFVPRQHFVNYWAVFNYAQALLGENFQRDVTIKRLVK